MLGPEFLPSECAVYAHMSEHVYVRECVCICMLMCVSACLHMNEHVCELCVYAPV